MKANDWQRLLALPLVFVMLPLAIALSIARDPLISGGVGAGVFAAVVGLLFARRLPAVFLAALAVTLCGYAVLGKGFAYLGAAPLFVGELVLLLGLFAAVVAGGPGRLPHSPLTWLYVAFIAWNAARTLPYLSTYGPDALRDGVVWIYALFAWLVCRWMSDQPKLERATKLLAALLPWFLVVMPVAGLLSRLAGEVIPVLPGSGVPVLLFKGGDAAVHLAGVAAFLLVGAARKRGWPFRSEWVTWTIWFAGFVAISTVRSAILSVLVALLVVLVLRPGRSWLKLLSVGSTALVLAVALNLQVKLAGERSISVDQFALNLQSIVSDEAIEGRSGSKEWRLNWWRDIAGYTFDGPYFWTGKGYGLNLADDDGYQVGDGSLRHPHSGHMMILAHGGVPAFVLWVSLQVTFAFSLLRAYWRAARRGETDWAALNLWLLAYWAAFIVNISFDVFLEGPMGGIWFWSLFGFAMAALRLQERPAPPEPMRPPSFSGTEWSPVRTVKVASRS